MVLEKSQLFEDDDLGIEELMEMSDGNEPESELESTEISEDFSSFEQAPESIGNTNVASLTYSEPLEDINNRRDVVSTKWLQVNWDKKWGGKIPNLHRQIISTDNPFLFGGQYNYAKEDIISLGSAIDGIKKKKEIVQPGVDLVVINEKGDTLGDFLRRKHYKSSKDSLKTLLETCGDNNIVYTKNLTKENIKLDVLDKKAKEDRFVKPGDNDAFLKKFRKKTVYEKSILKKLGITEKELKALVGPKSVLSQEEKARLLTIGAGIENKVSRRRPKRTVSLSFGDLGILNFLDICKLASLRNLYYASGGKANDVTIGQVYYRLKRLEKVGIVRNIIVYNSPGVWALTRLGRALIGSERKLPTNSQAGLQSVSERIYVNHIMACIYSGCIDILQEGVKANRLDNYGRPVLGETIVPEGDMISAMNKFAYKLKGKVFVRDSYKGETNSLLREQWEIAWRKWENGGKVGKSPEEESPWFYILFTAIGAFSSYIIPDIVIHRERNADGSPSNIAIEVERTIKPVDEYIRKLSVYKSDNRVYSKVIYVTPSKFIAKRVKEAADRIGFDRYDIVPVMNEDGIVKEGTIHWEL